LVAGQVKVGTISAVELWRLAVPWPTEPNRRLAPSSGPGAGADYKTAIKTRCFAWGVARRAENLARNLSVKLRGSTNIASAVRQWRRLLN